MLLAVVLTIAKSAAVVQSKSFVTNTHITAKSIRTVAIFTNIYMLFAFVHVFQYYLNKVGRKLAVVN